MILTQSEGMILNGAAFEPVLRIVTAVSTYSEPWFPRHEFTNRQLIEAFLSLQAKNLIVAHEVEPTMKDEFFEPLCANGDIELAAWPSIVLDEKILENELNFGRELNKPKKRHNEDYYCRRNILSYHLTPQGGTVWEKAAQVDWSKYYTWRTNYPEDADLAKNQEYSRGVAIASTWETLEKYIDWSLRWTNNIDPENKLISLTYGPARAISAWRPIYWKTLSCDVICSLIRLETEYFPKHHTREQSKRFRVAWEEYAQLFTWYTKPVFYGE